jgi:pimeloyl-ACP methyl ester carboxylesterase
MLRELPDTLYTLSGDAEIAFQLYGDGDIELVALGGPASHVEVVWEDAAAARYLERLGAFARVALFDRRGTGLSEPTEPSPRLEDHAADLQAVIEAAGFERPALLGEGDGGRLCAMFAATRPERVSALIVIGTSPSGAAVMTAERREVLLDVIEHHWGEGTLLSLWAPSRADDPSFRRWWRRFESAAVSAEGARSLLDLAAHSDITPVLGDIRAPTLVLHRREDQLVPLELGRTLAAGIPDACFVELDGIDNLVWAGDVDPVVEEIERFLAAVMESAVH